MADPDRPEQTNASSPSSTDDTRNETSRKPPSTTPATAAKEELFEALGHVRNAASILLDRATKDAALKQAASDAERVVSKLGAQAEPLARHIASELTKFSQSLVEAIEDKRKSEMPPPHEGHENKRGD